MSELWKRKIRKYFSTFDFDNDGVISKEDFVGLTVRFCSFGHADEQKALHLRTQMANVWDLLTKNADVGNRTSLTVEEMIVSLGKQRYDPQLMKPYTEVIHGCHDMLDVNRDGYLQADEYQVMLSQAGVPDPSFTIEAFKSVDVNGDGKLSIEEFTNAFFDFLFSEDEKCAFFCGPLDN